jgi:hypothetical protein
MSVSFSYICELMARFLPTMLTAFLPLIVFQSTKEREGKRMLTFAFYK